MEQLAALPPTTIGILVVVAFVAGFIDAIAGGGGILTMPALLAAGLPPHLTFGTNKGQAIWGTLAALGKYARAGLVDSKRVLPALAGAFSAALLGARTVLLVPKEVLRPVVLVLLVVVAAWLALRRGTNGPQAAPSSPALAAFLIATAIGFYDGFFGPGTGTFLIALHARFLGDSLDRASANAKVVNAASNLAAVVMFAVGGFVVWSIAVPMAMAQIAGGFAGSHAAIRGGAPVVRRVVFLVVVLLVFKLASDIAAS